MVVCEVGFWEDQITGQSSIDMFDDYTGILEQPREDQHSDLGREIEEAERCNRIRRYDSQPTCVVRGLEL